MRSCLAKWLPEMRRCGGTSVVSLLVGMPEEGERRMVSVIEAQRTAFQLKAAQYIELTAPITPEAVRGIFTAAARAVVPDEARDEMEKRIQGETLDMTAMKSFTPSVLGRSVAVTFVRTLVLAKNNIESISFEGLSLAVVQTLDLSQNKLKKVPQGLIGMRNLASLDLSYRLRSSLLPAPPLTAVP